MTRTKQLTTYLVVLLLIVGCRGAQSNPAQAQTLPVTTVPATPDGLPDIVDPTPAASIEHDTAAFTQGLLFFQGKLYESTGQRGQSKIRRLTPDGQVEAETPLDPEFFGEGLAEYEGRLYQLTYTSGVCLVYDENLKLQKQLLYGTEGWGLTADPEQNLLVFTDGTAEMRFLRPDNLTTDHKFTVTDGHGDPVGNLNELEWVNGEIWANVWTSDAICRIDPKTGKAIGWIHLTELVKKHRIGLEEVLNGIAYDPESDTLWITGKLWPKIYRFDNVKETFFKESPKD